MSTSIHDGLVFFDAGLYGTDDDPVDNVISRDGVLNGLMHACDSMGQVRVNYHPIAAGVANGQSSYETIETPDDTSQWRLFGGAPFGLWPLTLRQDGTPYRLVIRVGGASDTGSQGVIRVVIAPRKADAEVLLSESEDNVWEATIASATVAWLSGASQGDNAASNYVEVSRAVAERWINHSRATYDAVSSASPVTIEACEVSAWVFGKATADVDLKPQLHALHLREFIAP